MPILKKIIYSILFLLLILYPHFVAGHIYVLPDRYIQSLINFLLIFVAVGVYWLHAAEVKREKREKAEVSTKLGISTQELTEAFRYIGQVNRQLPLIKGLTTDLVAACSFDQKSKKQTLYKLLQVAVVSIAKVDWGLFRFLDVEKIATVKEITFSSNGHSAPKTSISNVELQKSPFTGKQVKIFDGLSAIMTSDQQSNIKCFIILPEVSLQETDRAILQAIVDQAQLFYQYLYNSKNN